MSPDPDKCKIIKNWPEPTSCSEVKSFLQTLQFNSKFLGGSHGQKSYPEATLPLRLLTKKGARFNWGKEQAEAFHDLKNRLCSDEIMVPYDTKLNTRLYVDSSPIGTQATIAQQHINDGETFWRPVNHTSRSWTEAESGYSQIERESNGILTGMYMNRMYTLGTHIEVITDHKPLVHIYNNPEKPKQLRVDKHRTKLLPFNYTVKYEPGPSTPCDYGSRHPPPGQIFNADQTLNWAVEDETDIPINRVMLEELLPQAITLDMVKSHTASDETLQMLIEHITINNSCRNSLTAFQKIFNECYYIDDVVMRGKQIIIPQSLQSEVIGLAHEGHLGGTKTLNLLRQSCWFPKMHSLTNQYVETCKPCTAANPHTSPEPLKPHLLPDRPWQQLHADFKGPIGAKYYLHIVIDQFSKYPEVDVVKSTSFEKLEPCLDRIMATHGIPEELITDNGSPYFSQEMQKYAAKMGFKHKTVNPLDPQSNGFAENFVKLMCKLVHTATVEGKDPKKELNTYLLQYRSCIHSTTRKSPAELLFGRQIKNKLPQFYYHQDTPDIAQVREKHDKSKAQQKLLADNRRKPKEKLINVGDKILIKQTKSTTKPPFDPEPFKVTTVEGNHVIATRGHQKRTRCKSHVKILKERPEHLKPRWDKQQQHAITNYREQDIESDLHKMLRNTTSFALDNDAATTATEEGLDHTQEADHSTAEEATIDDTHAETTATEIASDVSTETPDLNHEDPKETLFNITPDETNQMQTLIDNLYKSPAQRYSLRNNTSLQWNPKMNEGPAVIPSERQGPAE